MDDEIDSLVTPMLGEYEGLKFIAINQVEDKNELSDEEKMNLLHWWLNLKSF